MYQYTKALVSVLTPGWNGKDFVHRLLDSLIKQTYKPMEYIYVDDGSTDGTSEIVKAYQTRFQEAGISFNYIYKTNGGVSTAVEEGLKHVHGEFLCWPEYDDWLTPDSIEKKVKYLQEHSDCAVVTSDAWLVNDNDLKRPYGVLSHKNPNRFDRNHFVQALLSNSVFTAACQMCRMETFDKTHPNRHIFPSPIGPNWQILLPLYYKYNRGWIEEPLCYYYVRSDSISNSNYSTIEKRRTSIYKFIETIKETIKTIEMPKSDFELYNKLVDSKYAIDLMQLGYAAMNRQIFFEGLSYFEKESIAPPSFFANKIKVFKSLNLFRIMVALRKTKALIKLND